MHSCLLQDGSVEDMPRKAAITKTNQAYLATNYHEHPPTSSAEIIMLMPAGTSGQGQVLVYNKELCSTTRQNLHLT
jgi:hypothetical protein